jgi:hypothetical protein
MKVTVGELIEKLKIFDKDAELEFSTLEFYTLKLRGPKLVNVEFKQSIVFDPKTKTWLVQD